MARNPYEGVFDTGDDTSFAGELTLDAFGTGGNNISMGNGYTIDTETGDVGVEIYKGVSIDL